MTDRRSDARRWAAVGGTALISAVVWVALREAYVPAWPLPTFLGACRRLRESGLPVLPTDQICFPSFWQAFRLNLSWATFIQASGFWAAGVMLVAAGRRWSALLPPLILASADAALFRAGRGSGYPPSYQDGFWVWLVAVMLILAPVVVAVFVLPRRPRRRITARWWAWATSGLLLAVVTLVLWWVLANSLLERLGADIGAVGFTSNVFDWQYWQWLVSAGTVATVVVFGVLLGRAPGLWPWSLVLVALLLSGGPTVMLTMPIESAGQPRTTVFLGAVVPLFLFGLVWSMWGDVAGALDRRRWRDRGEVASWGGRPPTVVAANCVAAMLLLASVVAYRSDPWEGGVALPTYLDLRARANDVVTRMNIKDGLAVAKQWRREHGTYEGFRAADGVAIDSSVPWVDAGAMGAGGSDGSPHGVAVIPDGSQGVRVVGQSGDGAVWCLHAAGGRLRYGGSGSADDPLRSPAQVRAAIRHCDDRPWRNPKLDTPEYPVCDPVGFGYLICRMVTVLMHNILARDPPTDFAYAYADRWLAFVPVDWRVHEGEVDGNPQVTFWSGARGRLISATITDLGPTDRRTGRWDEGFAEVSHALGRGQDVGDAEVAYSWRAYLDGRAYRATVHVGRSANLARREGVVRVLNSIRALRSHPPRGTAETFVPAG